MLVETLLVILFLTVPVMVAWDVAKTGRADEHVEGLVHDARPRLSGAPNSGRTGVFLREPARTPLPTAVQDADPARRPESMSPVADGTLHSQPHPPTVPTGPLRELRNWRVRSRLVLLAIIPAIAVAAAAFCVAHIVDVLHGAPIHSPSSSVSYSAILSALPFGVVMIIIIMVALWAMIVVARSVLQPLHRLRAGALEMAGARLTDAARRASRKDGDGAPPDMEPIDVDSSDEMGEIARALDQMRKEALRLAVGEVSLQGKLNAMFANLSHRGQSLAERQIRLIQNLEQGERDSERLATLRRVNRIARRTCRNSQNLLILAGQNPSTDWAQPVTLVNVIRAAVAEVEEYQRVSMNAQPDIAIVGPAVNDLVHVLAELIENATSFSAAEMPIDISGHMLAAGGVLVDITDRGVGMAPKEMAYANWRLDNPPTADASVPRWMGLFVVARLAVRYGIRVRLQSAEFGGLTALVWLPDEIITQQRPAAASWVGGPAPAGLGRHQHEAAPTPGHAAQRRAATATSATFALQPGDTRDTPLDQQLIPDANRRPSPTWPASTFSPGFQAEPTASAGPSVSGLSDAAAKHLGVSDQQAPALSNEAAGDIAGGMIGTDPGWSVPGWNETSQAAGPAAGTAVGFGQDTSSSDGIATPPAEGVTTESCRLPVFEAVESSWFKGRRGAPSTSTLTATTESRWSSPADEGWRAAETADSPSSAGSTAAGLPKRQPNANLIPGAIPSTEPVPPSLPDRSAAAAHARLAGLQRGVDRGRAAAREAANPGEEEEPRTGMPDSDLR